MDYITLQMEVSAHTDSFCQKYISQTETKLIKYINTLEELKKKRSLTAAKPPAALQHMLHYAAIVNNGEVLNTGPRHQPTRKTQNST